MLSRIAQCKHFSMCGWVFVVLALIVSSGDYFALVKYNCADWHIFVIQRITCLL
jgi:hypothetical protein